MTQSRDPFGLTSLPQLQPQKDGWNAISAQLQEQRRRRQQWFSGLALAASVTLAIGVVAILPQEDLGSSNIENVAQQLPVSSNDSAGGSLEPNDIRGQGRSYSEVNPSVEDSLAANDTQADIESNANLAPENLQSLQRLSQRLEQNLGYLRTGLGSVPAEMVVYQVELEDLVAQVDAAISQQPESSELWKQRVNLLMDLNQIYGEGLRRDDPYVASL